MLLNRRNISAYWVVPIGYTLRQVRIHITASSYLGTARHAVKYEGLYRIY
jgi:hypothetical protein